MQFVIRTKRAKSMSLKPEHHDIMLLNLIRWLKCKIVCHHKKFFKN